MNPIKAVGVLELERLNHNAEQGRRHLNESQGEISVKGDQITRGFE